MKMKVQAPRIVGLTALVIAVTANMAFVLIAAAQQPGDVAVTLTDLKVSMSSTSIQAGVPVKFTATNNGRTLHEVVLERAGAVDQPYEMNGRETEIEDIGPGETKSATWTITQPGEYQLACHLPGHFEAGMVERFTVTAAAGAGQGQAAAPMQLAAPSAENQAEHEDQPAGGANIGAVPLPTPATLPVTGAADNLIALGWLAAGIVGLIAAIMGAFRLIVHELKRQE